MGNSGIVDEDINTLADFFYFAKYAADNVGIAYIAGESCEPPPEARISCSVSPVVRLSFYNL